MFEDLKKNLLQEKKLIVSMKSVASGFRDDVGNQDFYAANLIALAEQLDLLNNAVPELLKEWSPSANKVKKLPREEDKVLKKSIFSIFKRNKKKAVEKEVSDKKTVKEKVFGNKVSDKKITDNKSSDKKAAEKNVGIKKTATKKTVAKKTVGVSYVSPVTKEKHLVTINKKDKAKFLKKLKMSEDALAHIKKAKEEDSSGDEWKPNKYIMFSSKYFRRYSDKVSRNFADVAKDLKQANIPILFSSYLSMALMSCVIAFTVGVLVFAVLLFVSFSNWIFVFLPFGFLGLTMAGFYLYPSSEAGAVRKNISYELPFSTIHMAAIAGSNITPVKIFKIIAASSEYPNIGAEMKKVVVQIEVYGYDMVTSLKNVSKTTSNKKLSELFSGLATNINSGGELKNYLDKKSESFLTDYRLERQKYSGLAGTFMDVYISILIAAPLILMMMFIVMNVAGLSMGGLGIMALMGIVIVGLVMVNIGFIVVLNSKQPKV